MVKEYIKKTRKFVKESLKKASKRWQYRHFYRTAYWVKRLDPKADEAMLIAALSHDIERAYLKKPADDIWRKSQFGLKDKKYLEQHQNKSADIIADFLKKEKASKKLVDEVKHLVAKHEVGGDKRQNLIKDADCISFFENYIEYFLVEKVKKIGKEKVRKKFEWMFDKISSKEANEITRPMYLNAIIKLEELDTKKNVLCSDICH